MKRWRATALLLSMLGPAAFAGQTGPELRTDTFNSSALCGECHQEIHAMWQRSMHSLALSDPVFEVAFLEAYRDSGPVAEQICLDCHAPVAAMTGDWKLENPVSREGITCDFCHSVAAVDLSRTERRFRVVHDGAKRGPLADAESPVHGVVRSTLHESAEFCAGCHEYTNPLGVPVLTTFSEWQASPQGKRGKTCQQCHMPPTPGRTVKAGLGAKVRQNINLHNISGMHSVEQVRKAATARLVELRRTNGDEIEVEVEVANIGSGHCIPTGLPTRKLVLELTLLDGVRPVRRFERIYEKVMLDESGRRITEDHRVLMAAARLGEDTRLLPGERRREVFYARLPGAESLRAELRLRYVYEPKIFSRERISIEMAFDDTPD